jgi:hypothetical protein
VTADEQFPPPVIPSNLVVAERHPATREFLRRHVDMQFEDLRLLFRLPVEELGANVGCNFTAAAMMLNVVSGFSVWLYQTDDAAEIRTLEEKDRRRRSRRRFLGFVTEYWPRIAPEPDDQEVVARRLYEVRNSLAHDLGVGEDAENEYPSRVNLAKHRAFSLDDVVTRLERNLAHPLAVPVLEGDDAQYTVHLAGLYWALHRMLNAALDDRPQEIETATSAAALPDIEEVDE